MDSLDFVSYETAKKLKAAGFDVPCSYYYTSYDGLKGNIQESCNGDGNFNAIITDLCAIKCSAPTLWQAAKWLRAKKKMHCQVLLNGVRSMYFWQVRELVGNGKHANSTHQYDVYEDAMRDCIDAALELITNKTE